MFNAIINRQFTNAVISNRAYVSNQANLLTFKRTTSRGIPLVCSPSLPDQQSIQNKMQDVAVAALCLSLLIAVTQTKGEYEELCARFADGVKFRVPGNCKSYVTCSNGVGTITSCPDDQLYDKDNRKCVAKLTDNYCDNLCKGKNDVWIQDPTNCDGFYFCQAGEKMQGFCEDGFKFDERSQQCVFPSSSDCYGFSDFCGIVPNGVPFSDPDNCNKYYKCTRGEMKSITCDSNLYYDVASSTCINKYTVACRAHPIPANICGKDSKPISDKFVSDGATCRGYYHCAYKGPNLSDKQPAWNQCPEGYFFDEKLESCRDPTTVSCKYDRCDGRGNSAVVAEDFACQHYYRCMNGVQTQKMRCPKDMFFNEQRHACTYIEVFYPVCDF